MCCSWIFFSSTFCLRYRMPRLHKHKCKWFSREKKESSTANTYHRHHSWDKYEGFVWSRVCLCVPRARSTTNDGIFALYIV